MVASTSTSLDLAVAVQHHVHDDAHSNAETGQTIHDDCARRGPRRRRQLDEITVFRAEDAAIASAAVTT